MGRSSPLLVIGEDPSPEARTIVPASAPGATTAPGDSGRTPGVPLPRSFFDRPVTEVAPDLLGRLLVAGSPQGRVALRLTEVEAYAGEVDPGSHAFRGRTNRNAVMFGPPGYAYVYFTYGMHYCMNLVCAPTGTASAVLLRAGEVVDGLPLARSRRSTAGQRRPQGQRDRELARGPARLTVALGVDGTWNGTDVIGPGTDDDLGGRLLRVLTGVPVQRERIRSGPRVGVGGAGADTPWRFWIDGEPSVSAYRAHSRAGARRRSTGAGG